MTVVFIVFEIVLVDQKVKIINLRLEDLALLDN